MTQLATEVCNLSLPFSGHVCTNWAWSKNAFSVKPSQAETGSDRDEREGHSFYAPLLNETKISSLRFK